MKRLKKSPNRKVGGVLGGLAEYLEIDPTIVRLAFILLAVFTAVFPCVLAYLVAAIVMPER